MRTGRLSRRRFLAVAGAAAAGSHRSVRAGDVSAGAPDPVLEPPREFSSSRSGSGTTSWTRRRSSGRSPISRRTASMASSFTRASGCRATSAGCRSGCSTSAGGHRRGRAAPHDRGPLRRGHVPVRLVLRPGGGGQPALPLPRPGSPPLRARGRRSWRGEHLVAVVAAPRWAASRRHRPARRLGHPRPALRRRRPPRRRPDDSRAPAPAPGPPEDSRPPPTSSTPTRSRVHPPRLRPLRDAFGEHFGSTILAIFTDEPALLGRCREAALVPGTTGILAHVSRTSATTSPRTSRPCGTTTSRTRRATAGAGTARCRRAWRRPTTRSCTPGARRTAWR